MTFGLTLARLRRARGWSQEALALRAGLSQRHVSFLETGRARPGQGSLAKLAQALALKAWEQRALLQTIAPLASEPAAGMPDAALVTALIERFSLWPAYAFRPDGSLVGTNASLRALLGWASPDEDLWRVTAPSGGPNIYDLVFHPRGLIRWMENPEQVIPETLRRLRIEAVHAPSLLPALHRMEAYPSARIEPQPGMLPPSVLIERYRIGGEVLAIISVLSHLASPGELSLDELRIESFVPADIDSERFVMRLLGTDRTEAADDLPLDRQGRRDPPAQ
jgi:transcriptional regulator with XRE-family HTH domain